MWLGMVSTAFPSAHHTRIDAEIAAGVTELNAQLVDRMGGPLLGQPGIPPCLCEPVALPRSKGTSRRCHPGAIHACSDGHAWHVHAWRSLKRSYLVCCTCDAAAAHSGAGTCFTAIVAMPDRPLVAPPLVVERAAAEDHGGLRGALATGRRAASGSIRRS